MHKLEKHLEKIYYTMLDIANQPSTEIVNIDLSYSLRSRPPIDCRLKIRTTQIYTVISKILNMINIGKDIIRLEMNIKKIENYSTKKGIYINIKGRKKEMIDKIVNIICNQAQIDNVFVSSESKLGSFIIHIVSLKQASENIHNIIRAILNVLTIFYKKVDYFYLDVDKELNRIFVTIVSEDKNKITNEIESKIKNLGYYKTEVIERMHENELVIYY